MWTLRYAWCLLVLPLYALAAGAHTPLGRGRRATPPFKAPFARRHPEDKCGGRRMFYTPLLRSDGEQLGVCDSSCEPLADKDITDKDITAAALKRTNPGGNHHHLPHYLFTCNATKTLPEVGVPEEMKDAFPYHMRTCFLDSQAADDGVVRRALEVAAQKAFEESCNKARGVFTNPLYKTW